MALADTLNTIEPLGHAVIALDEPITTEADATAWRNYLENVSGPIEQHDAILVVPFGDIELATAFAAYAETKTSYRFVAACYHGSTELPALSASVAAAITGSVDVATPLDDIALKGLTPVDSSFTLSRTRIEAALNAGVAMIETGADGIPKIVRCITTYQQMSDGTSDDLMLDVNAPLILAYTRQVVRKAVALMPRQKNTIRARAALRTAVLNQLLKLDKAEILENVAALEPELIVVLNSTDATRADVTIPTDMVRGMHIIAATLKVY
jgi:phage tail sheath gpL-like